jgi:class 3 adenylate cyclase
VSILFADVVGFTAMAKTQPPDVVMDLLNDLFTR